MFSLHNQPLMNLEKALMDENNVSCSSLIEKKVFLHLFPLIFQQSAREYDYTL